MSPRGRQLIDADGFRANVAIVLFNEQGQLFWAKRVGMDAWQFPQGGVKPNETPEAAMFRELREETGLLPRHVEVVGVTRDWLRYRLPDRYVRHYSKPLCIGQKQRWYLLRLVGHERHFNLTYSRRPEFERWCWVDFWEPVDCIISFKRDVYQRALTELEPLLRAPRKRGAQE